MLLARGGDLARPWRVELGSLWGWVPVSSLTHLPPGAQALQAAVAVAQEAHFGTLAHVEGSPFSMGKLRGCLPWLCQRSLSPSQVLPGLPEVGHDQRVPGAPLPLHPHGRHHGETGTGKVCGPGVQV